MTAAEPRTVIRILYVEDNADTREMLPFMLAGVVPPCVVTGVETFAEGLLAAKDGNFDVYMIDSRLADGIGVDLCLQIRMFDQQTPIIFCSGFTDHSLQRTVMNSGATLFLAKPYDFDRLSAAVREACNLEESVSVLGMNRDSDGF